MRSIKINNGDIEITSKRLQIVDDMDQKMQKTKACIQTVLGELFYNTEVGLDYTKVLDINSKNTSIEQRKLAIIEAMFQDDNVEKVGNIDLQIDIESRKANITLQLKYKDEDTVTTIGGVSIG